MIRLSIITLETAKAALHIGCSIVLICLFTFLSATSSNAQAANQKEQTRARLSDSASLKGSQDELVNTIIDLRKKARKLERIIELKQELQTLRSKTNRLIAKNSSKSNISDIESYTSVTPDLNEGEALHDNELQQLKLALSKEKERAEILELELKSFEQEKRGEEISAALQEELQKELQFQISRAQKLESSKERLENRIKALRRFGNLRRKMGDEILAKQEETHELKASLKDQKMIDRENVILRDETYRQKKKLEHLADAASNYLSQQKLEGPSDAVKGTEIITPDAEAAKLARRRELVRKLRESFAEDKLKTTSSPGTEVFSDRGNVSQLGFSE